MASVMASQRSLVTLVANFADATFAVDPSIQTSGMIESRIQLLKGYWSQMQTNHLKLAAKERFADDPYFSENTFERSEARVMEVLSYLYDERSRLTNAQREPVRPTSLTSHQLPLINVPNFSGNQGEWESFRDLFMVLVHTNDSLTDVQRFYYLKAAVQGEAKAALEGVPITEASYVTVWDLLLKRYDNKRLLVQESLSALMSISELKNESALNLQSLLDTLNQKRATLKTLGRPVHNWDDWFVFLAARGMDSCTRRDWERELSRSDKIPTFVEVESFLQQRVWALKATEGTSKVTSQPSSGSSRKQSSTSRPNTRLMGVSTSPVACGLCGEQHYLGHCAELKKQDPDQRRKTVVQLKLCFNCLRTGHLIKDCSTKTSCRQCQNKHHSLLHSSTHLKRTNAEPSPGPNEKRTRSNEVPKQGTDPHPPTSA